MSQFDAETPFLTRDELERIEPAGRLPWRREPCGLSSSDWVLLQRCCLDLLRLDAAVLFAEEGDPRPLWTAAESAYGDPRVLRHEGVRGLARTLRLLNFNRFAFRRTCGASVSDAVRSFAAPLDPAPGGEDARDLWEGYDRFLRRWVFSSVFVELFALPYRTNLTVSESAAAAFQGLLGEVAALVERTGALWGWPRGFRLLNFWLRRLREAAAWPEGEAFAELHRACDACWKFIDPDDDRAQNYAGYCGSDLAGQFFREAAAELHFPVHAMRRPEALSNLCAYPWLDAQFYDRLGACTAAARGHPKGARLAQACARPNEIPAPEIAELLRFLCSFSAQHFMGHVGELVGLPLVIRTVRPPCSGFGALSCIPGSSLRVRTVGAWQQGPDAVLATASIDGDRADLEVVGIVEVKTFPEKPRRLRRQMARHEARLREGEIALAVESSHDGVRWVPWSALLRSPSRTTLSVRACRLRDPVFRVCVLPAQRREMDVTREGYRTVRMPWTGQGFRRMGLHFSCWLIENFGRLEDPADYDRGVLAWQALLRRLLGGVDTSAADRAAAQQLLQVLTGPAPDPDEEWA